MEVTTVGGLVRVQVVDPSDASEQTLPSPELAKEHNGSFRYSAESGQVEQTQRATASLEDFKGACGSGILATAMTPWGSPARELKPETLVDVGGQMAPLKVAEKMGKVRRDAAGNWIEVAEGERQSSEQQQPSEEEELGGIKAEPFSEADEAALVEAVGDVSTQSLGAVLIPLALEIAETGESSVNIEDVASKLGTTPERAAAIAETVERLFQGQADSSLKELQVDPQKFYEWARLHRLDGLRRAVANHLSARSLSDYRTLAKEYLRHTVPDAEGLKQAGYESRLDPTTRELMVKLRGVWVSVKAAARDGMI